MTDTYSAENKMLQTIFLKGFDFLRYKVLVRYRPELRELMMKHTCRLLLVVRNSPRTFCNYITDKLSEIDAENAEIYKQNNNSYVEKAFLT